MSGCRKYFYSGRGGWLDKILVECLWRSVKYEVVYLYAYESISAARVGIRRFFNFYNCGRLHSSLVGQMLDQIYIDERSQSRVA